jgi:type II restriction enzyme
MYHPESTRILNELISVKANLVGGTTFKIGDLSVSVEGKDGVGGLIEEWFGKWAKSKSFQVFNPKLANSSQEFPDYFVGDDTNRGMLEIKAFDKSASANFDIANFESYCASLAANPHRLDSDYLIFGYELNGSVLKITDVWLKKIWQITTSSQRWPLKTQTKRDVIYNIRPSTWYSTRISKTSFASKEEFVTALYSTWKKYKGQSVCESEQTYYSKIGVQ